MTEKLIYGKNKQKLFDIEVSLILSLGISCSKQSIAKTVMLVALYNALFSYFNAMVTVESKAIMLSNEI